MAARPEPLVLQDVALPDGPYVDYPTAKDTSFHYDGFEFGTSYPELPVIAAMKPWAHDSKWLRDTTTPADNITNFQRIPPNTCYRNSLLSALMNLPPFLNFLSFSLSQPKSRFDVILRPLAQLAVAWRNGQTADIPTLMGKFWTALETVPIPNGSMVFTAIVHPWVGGDAHDHTEDPASLFGYILQRILSCDLDPEAKDPDDPTMSLSNVFMRMFQATSISRIPYNCHCGPQKRRQFVQGAQYIREFNFPTATTQLQEVISRGLLETFHGSAWDPRCPVCKQPALTRDWFLKLAYLPECLFFGCVYEAPGKQLFNNPNGRAIFPEILDMANVRDDPTRPADQNTTYRLQAVIGLTRGTYEPLRNSKHFVSFVRRADNQWTMLDDSGHREDMTLDQVRNHKFRARMLLYARLHPPPAGQAAALPVPPHEPGGGSSPPAIPSSAPRPPTSDSPTGRSAPRSLPRKSPLPPSTPITTPDDPPPTDRPSTTTTAPRRLPPEVSLPPKRRLPTPVTMSGDPPPTSNPSTTGPSPGRLPAKRALPTPVTTSGNPPPSSDPSTTGPSSGRLPAKRALPTPITASGDSPPTNTPSTTVPHRGPAKRPPPTPTPGPREPTDAPSTALRCGRRAPVVGCPLAMAVPAPCAPPAPAAKRPPPTVTPGDPPPPKRPAAAAGPSPGHPDDGARPRAEQLSHRQRGPLDGGATACVPLNAATAHERRVDVVRKMRARREDADGPRLPAALRIFGVTLASSGRIGGGGGVGGGGRDAGA